MITGYLGNWKYQKIWEDWCYWLPRIVLSFTRIKGIMHNRFCSPWIITLSSKMILPEKISNNNIRWRVYFLLWIKRWLKNRFFLLRKFSFLRRISKKREAKMKKMSLNFRSFWKSLRFLFCREGIYWCIMGRLRCSLNRLFKRWCWCITLFWKAVWVLKSIL